MFIYLGTGSVRIFFFRPRFLGAGAVVGSVLIESTAGAAAVLFTPVSSSTKL